MTAGLPHLVWPGKHADKPLSACKLVEVPELSCGTSKNPGPAGIQDNRLIHADNLQVLPALIQELAGQVRCIFIDPPYNTGGHFRHYSDAQAHSSWLSAMERQLRHLHALLADNGSLWVSIDDNEVHYLKVLLDEIFGRDCFVASIVWRSSDNSNNDAKQFSNDHNYLLVYGRHPGWKPKPQRDLSKRSHFKNPDQDPRGPWFDGNPLGSPKPRPNLHYVIRGPQGQIIQPPKNGWRWSKETLAQKMASGEIRFTPSGKGIRRRTYLADMPPLPPSTLWAQLELTGHNRQAKYELKKHFPSRPSSELFSTPKPERLLAHLLELATDAGDWVLDTFAGSGTTGAVAHKMGRRWIMVEHGAHCATDVVTRLRHVVSGEDRWGVSDLYSWQGGGAFRFLRCVEGRDS